MSAVRAVRRTRACRAARPIDLPEPAAFPADHRPASRDPHPPAAGFGTGEGRWPHSLSHRGCGEIAPHPPIPVRRRAER